jgi:lipoyl(octanoyl) transferase
MTDAPHIIEWAISDAAVDYRAAEAFMMARADAIADGRANELIWLVEHPSLYTAGTSAKKADLLKPDRFPVYETGRGGQFTYHGPGQRVVYVMLDVRRRTGGDVRAFVSLLEKWIITTLDRFNTRGLVRPDRVGVWVLRPDKPEIAAGAINEDKIGAIGIRIRRGVSFHGFALNVEPNLTHFDGIVPCGISAYGVTSLVDLGCLVTMSDVDIALEKTFTEQVEKPHRVAAPL